jgi:hypothetical protein
MRKHLVSAFWATLLLSIVAFVILLATAPCACR